MVILVAVVGTMVFIFSRKGGGAVTTVVSAPSSSPAGISEVTLNKSDYEIALAAAAAWQSDAALSKMTLVDEPSDAWDFIFVSPKKKNAGFEIEVSEQTVVSSTPITLAGGGNALPADLISPDQAIEQARAVPGYGKAVITSVELSYNAAAKQWYWGVRTSAGVTLTINATQ